MHNPSDKGHEEEVAAVERTEAGSVAMIQKVKD